MKKVVLNKYVREQAESYADNEADIHGWKRGGKEWERAFKSVIANMIPTMMVGRNPRGSTAKYRSQYPEVFEEFAGRVAEQYVGKSGQKASRNDEIAEQKSAIQNRIMASVMNLSKIFENGVMGIKTTTVGRKEGKIKNEDMSELQFPNKEGMSDVEYKGAIKDVILAWVTRTIVTNAILESLTPFFTMSDADVEAIIDRIDKLDDLSKEGNVKQAVLEAQHLLADKLHQTVHKKMLRVSYVDMVLGKSE